jgi:hypothetical protein
LLATYCIDALPISPEFVFAGLVHIDPDRMAKARKRHHYTARLQLGVPNGPRKNIIDQPVGAFCSAPICLGKLQSLL